MKLSFGVTPSEQQAIAVDESVVKCGGGRAIYVWVAVGGRLYVAARLVRGLTHEGH